MTEQLTKFVNGEYAGWTANGEYVPAAVAWPTPEQQRQDPNWTAKTPRPTDGDCPDYALNGRRKLWDEAETKRRDRDAHFASLAAEREQKDRQAQAERDAAWDAKQQGIAAARETELHAAFAAAGGSEQDWGTEKADILKADRQRRTLAATPVGSLMSRQQAGF